MSQKSQINEYSDIVNNGGMDSKNIMDSTGILVNIVAMKIDFDE